MARAKITSSAMHIDLARARAFWFATQSLDRPSDQSATSLVRATGWLNTAGGHGPYLALHARNAAIGREALESAVRNGDLVECPSVRGCSMLVPREDVPLALAAGRSFHHQRFAKLRAKTNVTPREIARLSDAVRAELEPGPIDVEQLRSRLPAKLHRSLGEAGRALGEATTLGVAMRALMSSGEVDRVPLHGRLDETQYVFTLRSIPWDLTPYTQPLALHTLLARRFFAWAAPATRADFAWWAGIKQAEAVQALEPLALSHVSIESLAGVWLIDGPRRSAVQAAKGTDTVAFVPFRDHAVALRRDPRTVIDAKLAEVEVLDWQQRPTTLGATASVHHHTVLCDGAIIGIWEYDPIDKGIVWASLGEMSRTRLRIANVIATGTARFIAQEMGSVRYYAFDHEPQRALRRRAVCAWRDHAPGS